MTTELELPPVAHIVAELEEYETQEWNIGHLAVEPWISPTKATALANGVGKRRSQTSFADVVRKRRSQTPFALSSRLFRAGA